MDKYEFNIKLDQIKKLATKKDYKAAALIANTLDMRKVKDWSTLATVINVQEAAGFTEEARDTAILAYNRNQGGKRLVYKLTELFIRLHQFDDAEDLYNEYVHMAPHDSNRFLLEYKLQKAENAQVNTLIEILEEYREQEMDARYMYELAQLYSYADMGDKCIRICSDIILYFSDSEYCAPAVELKQKYSTITQTQQKLFEDAMRRKDLSGDDDHTKELKFAKAKEMVKYHDEMEDELESSSNSGAVTSGLSESYDDEESIEEFLNAKNDGNGPSMDLIQNEEADRDTQNFFKALVRKSMQEQEAAAKPEEPADGIETAKQSLNEMIENAHKNVEDTVENVRIQDREEKIEETARSIEVPVNDYNVYDTRNLAQELAPNINAILEEEKALSGGSSRSNTTGNTTGSVAGSTKNSGKSATMPVPPVTAAHTEAVENNDQVEEQIEGQMSIADWFEAVKEEKYGNRATKEFSKEELDRELAARESKEEAYDRLMAKQREEAHKLGMPFDEAEARRIANEQLVYQSAKQDLAIRTGKAAARMETEVVKQKEDDKIWIFAYKNRMSDKAQDIQDDGLYTLEEPLADEYENEEENHSYETDEYESEHRGDSYETENQYYSDEEEEVPEGEEYDDADEEDEDEDLRPRNVRSLFRFGRKKKSHDEAEDEEEYEDEADEDSSEYTDEYSEEYDDEEYDDDYRNTLGIEIPKEVRKFFTKYYDMDGVTEQLAEYFSVVGKEMASKTSVRGNIIISGNKSSDKANLAKNIARALNQLYPQYPKKIAKTSGESINMRGITNALPKLRGTVLIVEDAGLIEPKRIKEFLSVLKQDTDGMIVIFLGSDSEINVLLNVNPDITKSFNHRIVIKQYSVAELVDYARKYAGKRQHIVNDDALTLLYMQIHNLSKEKEYVSTDEIKEKIDCAIVKAERRAARKLFGRRARRGGEFFVLTESDFNE